MFRASCAVLAFGFVSSLVFAGPVGVDDTFPVRAFKVEQAFEKPERYTVPTVVLKFTVESEQAITTLHTHHELNRVLIPNSKEALFFWDKNEKVEDANRGTHFQNELLLKKDDTLEPFKEGNLEVFLHTATHGYRCRYDFATEKLTLVSSDTLAAHEAYRKKVEADYEAVLKKEREARWQAYEKHNEELLSQPSTDPEAARVIRRVMRDTPGGVVTARGSNTLPPAGVAYKVLVLFGGGSTSMPEAKQRIEDYYNHRFSQVAVTRQRDGSTLILGIDPGGMEIRSYYSPK